MRRASSMLGRAIGMGAALVLLGIAAFALSLSPMTGEASKGAGAPELAEQGPSVTRAPRSLPPEPDVSQAREVEEAADDEQAASEQPAPSAQRRRTKRDDVEARGLEYRPGGWSPAGGLVGDPDHVDQGEDTLCDPELTECG